MRKRRIITIVLIILLVIVGIIIYTLKVNKDLKTKDRFIMYEGDILPIPYGRSDIDIYSDGKIWAKSVEYGKTKKEILEEDLEKLKEKLKK